MTDGEIHHPEWGPTDDKYSDAQTGELPMSVVLYDGFECPDCGDRVTLVEFDPDPDAPAWHGECCENHYRADPTSVMITKIDT